MFNFLRKFQAVYSLVVHFYIPTSNVLEFQLLCLCQHMVILILDIVIGVVESHCSFNLTYP